MRELEGKRLLILGAYGTEVQIVRQAQAMGATVTVTDNHEDWSLAPAKAVADEAWDVSWGDFDALEAKSRARGVDGVLAGFSERRVACAQELARRLGIPFYADGANLSAILSKDRFKEVCISCGVDVPRSFTFDDCEPPVIVKPADNGGSRGITVCWGGDALSEACEKARAMSDSGSVLLEEYVVADEVMVYYVVHSGEVALSAMCDRYMKSFDPAITQLPVGYRFPSKYLEMFKRGHDKRFRLLIRSLGIKDGLIAFQCLVKDGRVMPFDPTYRLDGTMAYRATERVNGSNVLEMLIRHSLTGRMGDDAEIDRDEDPDFGTICFELPILLGPGRISAVRGLDEVESMNGVYFVEKKASLGDAMPSKADFSQMLCRIQLAADDESDLERKLARLFGAIDALDERGESMVLYRDAHALARGEVER